MSDEFSFSEWLENELKSRKMSQRALETLTGISQHTISKYISRGFSPRLCNLNEILNVLGKKVIIVDKEQVKEGMG